MQLYLCELLSGLSKSWAEVCLKGYTFLIISTKPFQILKCESPQISGIKNKHNCASSWLLLEDKIYCNKITVAIIALASQRKGLKLLTSR